MSGMETALRKLIGLTGLAIAAPLVIGVGIAAIKTHNPIFALCAIGYALALLRK